MNDTLPIADLMREHGLARVADSLIESMQPTIALSLTPLDADEDLPIGASKVGGGCDLPRGVSWPTFQGVNQRFMAQINLTDAASVFPGSPLPTSGLLSFFWCQEFEHGTDLNGFKVMHLQCPPHNLVRAPDPWASVPRKLNLIQRLARVKPPPRGMGFTPCAAELRRMSTIPDTSGPWAPKMTLDEEETDRLLGDLVEPLARAGVLSEGHRVLGAPSNVQNPVELEAEAYRLNPSRPDWTHADRGAKDWRLLLQLDSDHAPGFCFGDWGTLYYLLREPDLRSQRWDRVCIMTQCH